ncbi:Tuberous sclerosis 2 [Venturia nashicola]|uniref:Tuberous sclerosis 2 n=1 Tax=Venturia nashicola TaxID=86259 RepID=A0A4Z1P7G4_9PEZI|nr:Tuberous sclerosis 2 [Venturia nashicola]
MALPGCSPEQFDVRFSTQSTIAADRKTDFEQTEGDPMFHASPPPNAPRAPAAFRGRGRGRGFERSRYTSRGHGGGRGRGRSSTESSNQTQSSALDRGAVSIVSQAGFPIIGETGLGRHPQALCSFSAASTVGATAGASDPESQISTPVVGIPQGPAWNPPKAPRKYLMYQNQAQTQRTRTSSSSMQRASGSIPSLTGSQVAEKDEKQNLKTYAAVVAGLNQGLKAKVEASDGPGHVLRKGMGEYSGEEVETVYEQNSVPMAERDANYFIRSMEGREKSAERFVDEPVKISSSVDRPGWVRTTDEFMVLEFGSAGPITLRRDGPS